MDWISLCNFGFAVAGLAISLLGFSLSVFSSPLDKRNRAFLTAIFLLIIAYVACDLLGQISLLTLGLGYAGFSQGLLFCESLFSSLLMPLLTLYLLYCAGEDWRKSPVLSAVSALWLAYLALLIAAQFSHAIYYYTPDNVYHRGPWYPVLLVPPALLMLINLAVLYRRRTALTRPQRLAFSCYLLIPLVCMLIQMAAYGLYTIVIGTSVAAFLTLLFILYGQMQQHFAQLEENARQRASIQVLQMRPHFICNTMMSIYYLCGSDPKKAQRVTLDFTDYLRRNFTAIAKEGTIPFPEELAHTRAYLAVEKARFEDQLFVELDTPCTMFRVPPLTLQPIVENAVKHGLSPELDPLYLSVRTREADNGCEIVVEDTGPGFAPSDNEPHIALSNIRERLEMICRGKLTIRPREEGGTKVTVWVPWQEPEEPDVLDEPN